MISVNSIPGQTGLINQTPLVPTAMMPEEEVEEPYGTVKIVPPLEGGSAPKFINYGELNNSEPEDLDSPMSFVDITSPVDLDEMRKNATDIIPAGGSVQASNNLDSLLNIQSGESSGTYLSNTEKYIKTEGFIPHQEKDADYFGQPDFSTINLPTMNEPVNYTVEEAMNKIRELVADLENHGVSIHKDEMNFEKSHQVIIKIDKIIN